MYDIRYLPITLQQINIFLTAARYGNFTKAAAELNMSQSSVSRNIVLMEEALGIILFVRVKKRVRLTAAGEHLAKALAKPYAQLDKCFSDALQLQALEYNTLRICDVNTTVPDYYLYPVTERFEQENPDVELSITRKDPVDVLDNLAAGRYDMAFLPSVYTDFLTREGLEYEKFIDLKPCFIISRRHSRFADPALSYRELTDNPVVMPAGDQYSTYNDTVRQIMVMAGMMNNKIRYVDNTGSMSTELARADNVAILDEFYNPLGGDNVRYIKIEGIPPLFGFVVAWSPDNTNPHISRFVKTCRQIGAGHSTT